MAAWGSSLGSIGLSVSGKSGNLSGGSLEGLRDQTQTKLGGVLN